MAPSSNQAFKALADPTRREILSLLRRGEILWNTTTSSPSSCGGGPAPGINSVIGSATIRARSPASRCVGIHDGFQWLMQGDIDHVGAADDRRRQPHPLPRRLVHRDLAREPDAKAEHLGEHLVSLAPASDVDKLITIGGDDTAFSATKLERAVAEGRLRVVHVPKTIDNDLDLPADVDTFGYQTARHVGVEIVKNLMVDAKTTVALVLHRRDGTQGRPPRARHRQGRRRHAHAHPRGVPRGADPRSRPIVDTLVGRDRQAPAPRPARRRRRDRRGPRRAHRAEEDLTGSHDVERDAHGHIRIAEVNFGEILKARRAGAARRASGSRRTIVAKNIGYELRCADPIPFDMEYTRDLGYCAAQVPHRGRQRGDGLDPGGPFRAHPVRQIMDRETGRMRVRMVDIDIDRYTIARRYMLRLRRDDFDDPNELAKFAAAAHTRRGVPHGVRVPD